LTGLAIGLAVLLLPALALAQNPAQYQPYPQQQGPGWTGGGWYEQQRQQGQQGQGWYQQGPGYGYGYGHGGGPWREGSPYDPAGRARLGRTLGGAAGIAAGSFGGAMLASAVIKAAGVAALGPIAPILVGAAITAGGAFLGAKAFSLAGQGLDRTLGPDATWTMVGGIAGAVAGFALLPALGPFAGPMGRVLGAGLGGFLGGALGKMLAPKLDRHATAPMIYGATGALLGGVGFGVVGAVAGAAGGYVLGSIFDRNFFVDRNGSLRSTVADARDDVYDLRERFRDYRETVGDWVHDRVDRFGDRLRTRWPYYDHDSHYYDDYADSRRFVSQNYANAGGGSGIGYENYSSESAFSGNLEQAKAAYYRALEDFQRVNASGSPGQRADGARRVHEAQVNFQRAKLAAEQRGW
jgi:hypothetical protein